MRSTGLPGALNVRQQPGGPVAVATEPPEGPHMIVPGKAQIQPFEMTNPEVPETTVNAGMPGDPRMGETTIVLTFASYRQANL